jgi:RNA polymerase sigma-70 factor (sigma-E family)
MIGTMAPRAAGRVGAVDRDQLLTDLFREHYHALVRLACLLVDERESGEEIVQDAFVQLYRSAHRVRDAEAAPAYLRSIVLNLARSRVRRRIVARRHRETIRTNSDPLEDIAVLREDQREVIDALRLLPMRQRQCLALRYFAELSEAEIATTLGISTGSVKTHASRGRAALASALEPLR